MDNQENEKRQYILFEAVLNHVKEQARTKLPEKGIFGKFTNKRHPHFRSGGKGICAERV